MQEALLSGTTATTESAWKQAVQLTFTSAALLQLADDLTATDSDQLTGKVKASPADRGFDAPAAAGPSAAAEHREQQCWQCPLLQEPLAAARSCLTQALKQQYECTMNTGCSTSPWQTAQNSRSSCLAGPAAVSSGCVSWLTACVSLAAHTLASKLPGVAQAQLLLDERAKNSGAYSAKVINMSDIAVYIIYTNHDGLQ